MIKKLVFVAAAATLPLVAVSCKNGPDSASTTTSSADADHIKDLEAQLANARSDNDKLRQENTTLRESVTRLEQNRQQAMATPHAREANPAKAREVPALPREKQAVRDGVSGGTSFK